ncbi:uncharacterized protein TNCV_1915511 [Trichonephila clavipes]|uniref:Peptidase A2 domain-containing protein n=1 Tax=Trichonephila clavipes TaxID=2585209 RepID=A0A8X7BBA3_TRICX|nr:uncharacterized protein TNCV_1915511 [Trichonephila clavipes]
MDRWIEDRDTFDKLSDLIITDQLKRITPFEFKEYYFDEWANMNSPVQLAEKLEFKDFKRTLKQKSSSPFVKKQEFKNSQKIRICSKISRQRAERVLQQKLRETLKSQCFQAYAQTNYSKSQKFKEPPKETFTLIFKEGLRTKEIVFEKVKITALIDSGSTASLLRENTSRRIMDPTKLSKNKMLLTGIGEAQVTTIGSLEHEFKIDDKNYSLTWHVVPADKLKFEAVIGSDLFWNKHR